MKFEWALHLIKEDSGKCMYRFSNKCREIFCNLGMTFMEYNTVSNISQEYKFTHEDFLADDWEVKERSYIGVQPHKGGVNEVKKKEDKYPKFKADFATDLKKALSKVDTTTPWNNKEQDKFDKHFGYLHNVKNKKCDCKCKEEGKECKCNGKCECSTPNIFKAYINGNEIDVSKIDKKDLEDVLNLVNYPRTKDSLALAKIVFDKVGLLPLLRHLIYGI